MGSRDTAQQRRHTHPLGATWQDGCNGSLVEPQLVLCFSLFALLHLIALQTPTQPHPLFQMRFPELYSQLDGDTDRVAARVASEYLQGMSWVLRYYACGPAAISWRQQQQQGGAGSSSGSAGEVPGASWSWCYKHHYAPLMQVRGRRGGGRGRGPGGV